MLFIDVIYECRLSFFFYLDLFLLIHRLHFYVFNSWGTQIAMSPVYLCTKLVKGEEGQD